jgi:hypothetical protein
MAQQLMFSVFLPDSQILKEGRIYYSDGIIEQAVIETKESLGLSVPSTGDTESSFSTL